LPAGDGPRVYLERLRVILITWKIWSEKHKGLCYPASIQERSKFVISISSGGIRYGNTCEFLFQNTVKIVDTQSIIRDGRKQEEIVIFVMPSLLDPLRMRSG